MLSTSIPIAFLATENPEKARDFYENTLGLIVTNEDAFALVLNAGGIMLRIQKVSKVNPAPHTTMGWDVKDIEHDVMNLHQQGVKFERYNGMGQSDKNIWTSPSGAKIAWFKDPDGNILSLTQFK